MNTKDIPFKTLGSFFIKDIVEKYGVSNSALSNYIKYLHKEDFKREKVCLHKVGRPRYKYTYIGE